jgi:hypothetical protein
MLAKAMSSSLTPRGNKQSLHNSSTHSKSPAPNPQSQSFSQGYGSVLPTSLTHFLPLARGCKPWRPDAVIGTSWSAYIHPSAFQEHLGMHGTLHKRSALHAVQPFLPFNRFQGMMHFRSKDNAIPNSRM